MLVTRVCVQGLWKADKRSHWQQASDVQSGTEVDRSGKVGGGRQDADGDKKREVLIRSEDEEVTVFRLWLAHI